MQVCDGYFVKYLASVVALLVYGAPIYFQEPAKRGSQDDITQDYIRAMRLLQNTSRCVLLSLRGSISRSHQTCADPLELLAARMPCVRKAR